MAKEIPNTVLVNIKTKEEKTFTMEHAVGILKSPLGSRCFTTRVGEIFDGHTIRKQPSDTEAVATPPEARSRKGKTVRKSS